MSKFNKIINQRIPNDLYQIAQIFIQKKYSIYIVGGALRDILLERTPLDWDLITNALPQDVKKLFPYTLDIGEKYGTITVLYKKKLYEITTLRQESLYIDKRHPQKVIYANTPLDDLKRRDFTINALIFDLNTQKLIDFFKAKRAIRKKKISTIGVAKIRFLEDPLRLLRAFRILSQIGFSLDKQVKKTIRHLAQEIQHISSERIYKEMNKLLLGNFSFLALQEMYQLNFLSYVLPLHTKVKWHHLPQLSYQIHYLWSYLLHREKINNIYKISQYLKFSRKQYQFILHLHHLLNQFPLSSLYKNIPKLRECLFFYFNFHIPNMKPYLRLSYLKKYYEIIYNSDVNLENKEKIIKIFYLFKKIIRDPRTILNKQDLKINGYQLINYGIEDKKEIGKIITKLLHLVIKYPQYNKVERLNKLTKGYIKKNKIF